MSYASLESVVDILRRVGRGELSVRIVSHRDWEDGYASLVHYDVGEWPHRHRFVVFNDCGSFDYFESFLDANGRVGSFEIWGKCPLWQVLYQEDSELANWVDDYFVSAKRKED